MLISEKSMYLFKHEDINLAHECTMFNNVDFFFYLFDFQAYQEF